MIISVYGAGYVGLATGTIMAFLGHDVTMVEKDADKVATLQRGRSPLIEDGMEMLVTELTRVGRLRATLPGNLDCSANVVFIAVGTPASSDGSTDFSAIREVCGDIAQRIDSNRLPTIVIKATVPPGTSRRVAEWIGKAYALTHDSQLAQPVAVVSQPEFLREGTALADTLYPDRIVIGADDAKAEEIVLQLYQPIITQSFDSLQAVPRPVDYERPAIVRVTPTTSEMIKYAANAFLATKISFANEIANICETVDADITDVMSAIGMDPRIGPKFLQAGIGWGGGCLGKDLSALISLSKDQGYLPRLLEETAHINNTQRHRVVEILRELLSSLTGRRVALWGLAFKPFTNDVRDAPALTIINDLLREDAFVSVYDPIATDAVRREYPEGLIHFARSAEEGLAGADGLVVVTEWPEFRAIPLSTIRQSLKGAVLVDGRNIFDPLEAEEAGLIYRGIGRRSFAGISSNRFGKR